MLDLFVMTVCVVLLSANLLLVLVHACVCVYVPRTHIHTCSRVASYDVVYRFYFAILERTYEMARLVSCYFIVLCNVFIYVCV